MKGINLHIKTILSGALVVFLSIQTIKSNAQIRLPKLVSDGMVLQRDQKLPLWGWAVPGESVTVKFLGKQYHAKTGPDAEWHLNLPPTHFGGPYEMAIVGTNTIIIKNILIGDVWLCSGQSNMEFVMGQVKDKYASEIASAGNSRIRQFFVKHNYSFNPVADVTSEGWVTASPESVLRFTAVGYFFARELFEKYQVPIGLINSSYGGTPAEAWASEEGLQKFPDYLQKANFLKNNSHLAQIESKDKALTENWFLNVKKMDLGFADPANLWIDEKFDDSSWASMKVPGFWDAQGLKGEIGIVYFKTEVEIPLAQAGKDATIYLGKIKDQDSTYFNGKKIGFLSGGNLPRIYKIPGALVKAGKNTITVRVLNSNGTGGFDPYNPNPYQLIVGGKIIPLSGAWKYKVAASVGALNPDSLTRFNVQPTALYNSMIAPLIPYGLKGVIWYQGESNAGKAYQYRTLFPELIGDWRKRWGQKQFPFLYVQLANYLQPALSPSESSWAELREAQSMTLLVPNTAMAVTHDIGQGNDVHPLNKKDVGHRLALAAENMVYNDRNVIYTAPTYESMRVEGDKIELYFKNIKSGLTIKGGGELKYFTIAGADRKFVWATAKIEGDKIIVWSDQVKQPVSVRYAWASNPEGANLYNNTGLPVSSFRTDNWQLEKKMP